MLEMLPTPERAEALVAGGPLPELPAVAFNAHREPPMDLVAQANHPGPRELGPASTGGIGSARGVAALYAAAIGPVGSRDALLKPDTGAEFARLHTPGQDAVTADPDHSGLGFEQQPAVGPEAFGRCGAAGGQGFADPVTGIAYGCTRRRFGFPGGLAPENGRLTAAGLGVARGLESGQA
ncbi:hypothetical protein ACGFZK_20520 [Streptomyces sp. NPDC048257]|uniref:hypothetical protein n=1 Tax=Streptomyces sp. NPDC048257 TaxID=3365526 RepID=UPI00371FA8D4